MQIPNKKIDGVKVYDSRACLTRFTTFPHLLLARSITMIQYLYFKWRRQHGFKWLKMSIELRVGKLMRWQNSRQVQLQ